jgi:hypothetical protein
MGAELEAAELDAAELAEGSVPATLGGGLLGGGLLGTVHAPAVSSNASRLAAAGCCWCGVHHARRCANMTRG